MGKFIQHQIFYPNTMADIWQYLTDAELVKQWLMPSNIKPVVGHQFQFTTKPKPDMGFDGIFHCEILEADPYTTLTYSWNFGSGDGNLTKSVVYWTLTEKDNGTEVLLQHRGIDGTLTHPLFADLEKGWHMLIQRITLLLNPENNGPAKA